MLTPRQRFHQSLVNREQAENERLALYYALQTAFQVGTVYNILEEYYDLFNLFNQHLEVQAITEYFKDTVNALSQEQSQIASYIGYEGIPIIDNVLKLILMKISLSFIPIKTLNVTCRRISWMPFMNPNVK